MKNLKEGNTFEASKYNVKTAMLLKLIWVLLTLYAQLILFDPAVNERVMWARSGNDSKQRYRP